MNIRPGETLVVDADGTRRTASLYPTREERLIADVPELVARIAELEHESAVWEKASVAALVARREEQDRRIAELEAQRDALQKACKGLLSILIEDAEALDATIDNWPFVKMARAALENKKVER